MGLFNKLKEILFDEETVEIPVITKNEKQEEERKVKEPPKREARREPEKISKLDDEEVIIRKIETPKRSAPSDDDLFEMPKLKETQKAEVQPEPKKQPKTFTFPVFDDDEIKEKKPEPKEEKRTTSRVLKEEPTPKKKEKEPRKASGYTNAYDYSYGKYKGDYKSNRESNQAVLKSALETKEVRKSFTPSPIISPVYGVLNENYKKEDIVSKSEKKETSRTTVLDLDSVRRKAYGTLEDEIELSLTQTSEIPVREEEPKYVDENEGLSIDDLLVDNTEEDKTEAIIEEFADEDESAIFDEIDGEIDGEDYIPEELEIDEPQDVPERKPELDKEPSEKTKLERKSLKDSRSYSDEVRDEVKKEKTKETSEPLGEEDLFDLIDSLYQGKGEE